MRIPASFVPAFFWNESGKPSVTRVETNRVPPASRFAKLIVVGKAEPLQRMPVVARVASRPRVGTPTLSGVVLLITPIGMLVIDSTAWIACWKPAAVWLTFPRRLLIRRLTFWVAG